MSKKLKLLGLEAADLEIISAAVQDGIFLFRNASYLRGAMRFSIVIERFRHEEPENSQRVQSILAFEGVLGVKTKGVNIKSEIPEVILSFGFVPEDDPPGGEITIFLAGDKEIALDVECIDISLTDFGDVRAAKARPEHNEN